MVDSSHGSAHPANALDAARNQCPIRDFSGRITAVERAARWRGWVERAGSSAPRAPMWTSRESWLAALRGWVDSPGFAACAQAAKVRIAPATLLGIAAVMAEHADHATGRHVAITRVTIAERVGCSPDTVTAAWRLLRTARWAVEAQRGHGSPITPAAGRRPSVYHLVSRREPQPAVAHTVVPMPVASTQSRAGLVDNPDLPPKADFKSLSPVGIYSPSAHARPKQSPETTPTRRRYRATPRPLAVQRLAAELVSRCHSLHSGHIGAVCDAITAGGIDPAVWSARAITDTLNTDMKTRGWSWPDRIERPGAFLASRLRRLDWRPDGPPKGGGQAAASPEQSRRPAPQRTAVLTAPQRERIAAAKADIRATIAAAQARRSTGPGQQPARVLSVPTRTIKHTTPTDQRETP